VTPRALATLAVALVLGCTPVPVPRRSSYHASDADLGVTRIAHGSVILELRGTRVLVDPWFHSGLIVRQAEPLGLLPDGLPAAAAVLITHRHGDRFDADALRPLAATVTTAVAPRELHASLEKLGFRDVVELGWWDRAEVAGLAITAVPARHSVPENGYVIEANGVQVYVAGDTRWFPELVDVATRFPHLDAALLPVGGERLLGFRREMDPGDAARAAALLDPRRIVPIGYGKRGAFPFVWHARHPTERFIEECGKRGISRERIVVLEPGESWHYYR
jgi:L-ascorbate metabolism protein UlaG (beta-lactamase superfamily)